MTRRISSFQLFPQATAGDRALADRILFEGAFENHRYGSTPLDGNIWASGPEGDRNWLWTLHAFLPLDSLIAANEWEAVDALVRSWIAQFADYPVSADFPWHDHATALRLDRLSRIAMEEPACSKPDLAARHANLLLDVDFYSQHTNHGFDQAYSLVLASLAFEANAAASEWRQVGLRRLCDEIEIAFTSEGVHVENSPQYHQAMLANLVRVKSLGEHVDGLNEAVPDRLLNDALTYLAWIARPDGRLALMGDTVEAMVAIPEQLADLGGADHVRWARTGGAEGYPIKENSVIYEEAGYAIYRSNWNQWSDHVHIIMKCGLLSSYHRQDDDLNLLLHAYGEDWLIDSGMFNYDETDPIREYMRSPIAHNIPYLEGLSATRSPSDPSVATIQSFDLPDCELAVEANTAMYHGARLRRQLVIEDQDNFYISDRIRSPADTPCYWLFHIPLDKRFSISRGSVVIGGKERDLVIRSSDEELAAELHAGMEGKFPSVVSAAYNHVQNSRVLVFGPSDQSGMKFRFTFRH